MAITKIQDSGDTSIVSASSKQVTLASDTTPGNLIVIAVFYKGASVTTNSPTDGVNDANYQKAVSAPNTAPTISCDIYFVPNAGKVTAGSNFTASISSGTGPMGMAVSEYSGGLNTLDQTGTNINGANASTGTVTTNSALTDTTELVVAAFWWNVTNILLTINTAGYAGAGSARVAGLVGSGRVGWEGGTFSLATQSVQMTSGSSAAFVGAIATFKFVGTQDVVTVGNQYQLNVA